MIIAWGIFIVSVFSTILLIYVLFTESERKSRETNTGLSLFVWFILSLSSAQYIWG